MSILDGLFENEEQALRILRDSEKRVAQFVENSEVGANSLYQHVARGLSIAEALEIPPEKLETANCMALQLVKAGDYARARAIYLLLSQLQPLDERFAYGMATTFQLEGNFQSAVRLYQYYLTFAADCPQVRLRIGECLLGAGEYADAADLFSSGVELAAEQGKADLVQYANDMATKCRRMSSAAVQ